MGHDTFDDYRGPDKPMKQRIKDFFTRLRLTVRLWYFTVRYKLFRR